MWRVLAFFLCAPIYVCVNSLCVRVRVCERES